MNLILMWFETFEEGTIETTNDAMNMTRFDPKEYQLAACCFVVFQFVSDFNVILTAEKVAACRRIGWPLMTMRQVMGFMG